MLVVACSFDASKLLAKHASDAGATNPLIDPDAGSDDMYVAAETDDAARTAAADAELEAGTDVMDDGGMNGYVPPVPAAWLVRAAATELVAWLALAERLGVVAARVVRVARPGPVAACAAS